MTEPTPLFAVPALAPLPPASVLLEVRVDVDLARLIRARQEEFDAQVAEGHPPAEILSGWVSEALSKAEREQPESLSWGLGDAVRLNLLAERAVEAAQPTYPKCRVGDPPPLYGSASGS